MFTVKAITSKDEMWQALKIRETVFVAEQGIPRDVELDGRDGESLHILVYCHGLPVATGRFFMESDREGNLSRIAILPPFRGKGLGKRIVRELEKLAAAQGASTLCIYPHYYLETFYFELGYQKVPGDAAAGKCRLIRMEKIL